MSNIGERNYNIDTMKGFAIVLVVIGHAIQYNVADYENNFFFNLIYSFHMPLFMLLSGYIAFLTVTIDSFNDSIKVVFKKVRSLLVPYIAWGIIIRFIREQLVMPNIWFLWVLFLNFLVLIIFLNIKLIIDKRGKGSLDLFLGLLLIVLFRFIPMNFLNSNLLKLYVPFFITGFYIAKYKGDLVKYSHKVKEISLLLLPLILIKCNLFKVPDFILRYYEKSPLSINKIIDIPGFATLYSYLIAFIGISITYFAITSMKQNILYEKLRWIGKYTLEIYIIHFFFINIVGVDFVSGLSVLNSLITILLASVVSITFSLFISNYLIKQSKVLSLLLLGKQAFNLS